MSLLRSHICKFIVGVLIIFIISPIPALFITHKYSYITGFISIFHNFAQLSSMTIQRLIGCTNLSYSQQMRWFTLLINQHRYSLTYGRYIFYRLFVLPLLLRSDSSSAQDRPFIFKAPQSVKKFTSLLRWIPYSLCTVLLQCSVLLLLLYITKFMKLPYYSSFIIVCSTSMIIVMQAIKMASFLK